MGQSRSFVSRWSSDPHISQTENKDELGQVVLGQDSIGQSFQGNVGGAGKLGQHLLPLLGGLWELSYGTAGGREHITRDP